MKWFLVYVKIDIIEFLDEKVLENLSDQDMKIIKDKEGDCILFKISFDVYVIVFVIEGKMKIFEELVDIIDKLVIYGKSKVIFVIGGLFGLSDMVMKWVDDKLLFLKMMFFY